MRAGELRHTISIQERTETTDNMGGFTETWANVSGMGSVPAAIWPISANEIISSDKAEMTLTHRIRIRYRSGVNSKMRVLFGSRTFDIQSIVNADECNIMIDMLCEERNV